ncbi:Mediator of RNA polymerase II transcription subunit 6 [Bulinus truncatus]|nr:Mediator of RNA polymerase II transcription subunit 6 [Bulinus truncatus]
MQRLSLDQMLNMTGLEYSLLHAQEPVLYVIRKPHRHSPTQVTPLADYYIIAGTVYQSPDLCSVVNSRLLNTLHNLQSAFEEAQGYARFHPSSRIFMGVQRKRGKEPAVKDKKIKKKEEASSAFQRQRVDLLLGELAKKHPPLFTPTTFATSSQRLSC